MIDRPLGWRDAWGWRVSIGLALLAAGTCAPSTSTAQTPPSSGSEVRGARPAAGGKAEPGQKDPGAGQDFQVKYFDLTEGRVAFSYVDGNKRDIYVLDFHELTAVPVITTPGTDEAPSWSPDGKKLVFQSDATGNFEIYSANYDGTDVTQLTNSPTDDQNPQFTPDGKQIIFQSARSGGDGIFIMNADGTKPNPLLPSGPVAGRKDVTPRISPRGTEVAYVTNAEWPGWDIMLFDMKTKESQVLTQGLGSYIRPSWKPDGAAFAFSYGVGQDVDIWIAEKGRSQPIPLVRRDGRDLDPCFDDKGDILFFVGESAPGMGDFQLFAFDPRLPTPKGVKGSANESKVVKVMVSRGSVRHPAWTPFPSLSSLVGRIKAKQQQDERSGGGTAHPRPTSAADDGTSPGARPASRPDL